MNLQGIHLLTRKKYSNKGNYSCPVVIVFLSLAVKYEVFMKMISWSKCVMLPSGHKFGLREQTFDVYVCIYSLNEAKRDQYSSKTRQASPMSPNDKHRIVFTNQLNLHPVVAMLEINNHGVCVVYYTRRRVMFNVTE